MAKIKFKHFPDRPARLTAEFAKSEYNKLLARVPGAEAEKSPGKWLKLFADINDFDAYLGGEASRIHYAYSKDMSNKKLDARQKYMREKFYPAMAEPGHKLLEAIASSKHLPAIAKRYGDRLPIIFNLALKPSDPVNKNLNVAASKLVDQYQKAIAKALVKVRGKQMTLWQTRGLRASPDESDRKASFIASGDWFLAHHKSFLKLFDELVKLRQRAAKNVGYTNFTLLAYESLERTDYGPAEAEQFRQSIKKYFVPLHKKITTRQAKALEVPRLKPWNAAFNTPAFNPLTSLPPKAALVKNQLSNAQKVFDSLSPWLGEKFEFMREHQLIDLENRPNKQSGAYCTSFEDQGVPALLCNSIGEADDVGTLTHEMGHAFQSWASASIEAVDLQNPTFDLCEVHSMGMEFLAIPKLGAFFDKENMSRFKLHRYEEAVNAICYICVVDEFQHWIYQYPKATPTRRDERWSELFDKYLPDIDWRGFEKYKKTRWYAQGHIFSSPFYYIDYALAETAAMQIAMIDTKDHKKAMKIYMELCRLGGTKSFLAALEHVGLRSPFDESLIKDLATHTAKTLGI